MRKPRDFDADLAALDAKARDLRARKVMQFGELVIACKADALPPEMLAGALFAAAASKDASEQEAWRDRGAAFFRGQPRGGRGRSPEAGGGAAASDGATPPPSPSAQP